MRKFIFFFLAATLTTGLLVVSGGCAPGDPVNNEEVNDPEDNDFNHNNAFYEQEIELPEPGVDQKTVSKALYERRSRRSYSPEGLDQEEIGNLLWAAGGVGIDGVSGATRTAASAGGIYPLDVYLVAGPDTDDLRAGVYRYDHADHVLVPVAEGDRRDILAASALDQAYIAEAPVNLVLVGYYERTTGRYGDRGERYVHMDAGHASQNIYLMSEALDLGTVAIGAFDDTETAEILETGGAPLMILPVGRVE